MIKNSKEPESIYDVISKEWKKEKEIRPKRDQYSFFKKLITNLLKETDYRQKIEEMGITQFKHLHDTKTDEYHLYSEFTQTQDSQSNTPIYKRTDEIERLDVEYLIPDEKGIAELYVTCLSGEDKGIDVKELDQLTDLLKAVRPGFPKKISRKGGRKKGQWEKGYRRYCAIGEMFEKRKRLSRESNRAIAGYIFIDLEKNFKKHLGEKKNPYSSAESVYDIIKRRKWERPKG